MRIRIKDINEGSCQKAKYNGIFYSDLMEDN